MTLAHSIRSTRLPALALVLAVACTLLPAQARAAEADSGGFGVAPLRYDLDAQAGARSAHPITITNTDTVAITYTFSKMDFQGDKDEPEATPVMLGGKFASAISGYDWLGLPDAITIPAGETRTVSVNVSVPSGATGGHYAAVIVSGAGRSADELIARSRVAVLFLMNAGGVLPPDIVVTEVTEQGPDRTVTEFINNGKTETTPEGEIITRDPITNVIIRRTPATNCTTALPGGSGQCTFERKPEDTVRDSSPSGFEKDYIEVGDPDGDLARTELPAEWAGTWTSMLLPLVGVTLFVTYFVFLRRRRVGAIDDGLALDDGLD